MSTNLENNSQNSRPGYAGSRHRANGPAHAVCALLLKRLMTGLSSGKIRFVMPGGGEIECVGSKPGPEAIMRFSSYAGIYRLVFGGYMGLGEGYLSQDWSTPSLRTIFQFGLANQESLRVQLSGNISAQFFRKIMRVLQKNSPTGSRKNIAYHYDLGNAFYELWLDPSMTYSSAIFEDGNDSLQTAQIAKYQRIVDELKIEPHHQVLEIGCGWGGFAEHAAKETGAAVTALTISQEQFDYATDRMARHDLADRVSVEMRDYREQTGQFDRIVSIEMLEAVGEQYWPDYFKIVSDCLKPGGQAMIQVITVPDQRFENYRKKSDFIQRHIFPGGMLLSPGEMTRQSESVGLDLTDLYFFGESYAKTLDRWRDRFDKNWPEVEALGFDDRFRRLWEYYLTYTAAGFHAGTINVGQFLLTKKS